MHEPWLFEEMPAWVSLTLAAHTHGGQVNLPIVGRLALGFRQRYAYGLIEEGGRKMAPTLDAVERLRPVTALSMGDSQEVPREAGAPGHGMS
jgi:uncharacterized protein